MSNYLERQLTKKKHNTYMKQQMPNTSNLQKCNRTNSKEMRNNQFSIFFLKHAGELRIISVVFDPGYIHFLKKREIL
jgi:hypothetical protein